MDNKSHDAAGVVAFIDIAPNFCNGGGSLRRQIMPLSTYLVVAPIAYLIICLTFIYLGWSYKKTLKTSEVLLLSLSAVIGIMLGLVLIFELLPLLWDYILPLFEGALHQAPFFVS